MLASSTHAIATVIVGECMRALKASSSTVAYALFLYAKLLRRAIAKHSESHAEMMLDRPQKTGIGLINSGLASTAATPSRPSLLIDPRSMQYRTTSCRS